MTGKPANLRRARKQRARQQARTEADASAARHGEAKPVRSLRQAQDQLEARRLDGHRNEHRNEHRREGADERE